MVGKIYIPEEVKKSIREHLEASINRAVKGFSSAYEDEDVMTGHLFGLMKIDEQNVEVQDSEIGGIWKWSIDYKKFGGRGKNSTEKKLGADGIFELNLTRNGRTESKSLLFQSKLEWKGKDSDLYKQCVKLLTWLGASTVINYTESEFETYKVEDIFSKHGEKPTSKENLKDTLCLDFLNCHIGDADLFYDAFSKKLTWLDIKNNYVSTQFNLNRRLKIKIKAPNKFPYETIKVDKQIPNDEIHNHKLNNENSNFNIESTWNDKELKKKINKISNTFHPDKHPELPVKEKNNLDEMMKEFNNLFDLQRQRIKRNKS
ncbi:hypothetical protein [Flavobacterium sp. XGLA_31]|uniref:hypothetical protein n=1 Tax=Flavobacterium sp. XGLA_31 TaxID=3447666 RepID=UPI003F391E69